MTFYLGWVGGGGPFAHNSPTYLEITCSDRRSEVIYTGMTSHTEDSSGFCRPESVVTIA
jgi:hypothetical protein